MLSAPAATKAESNKEQILELPQALSIFAAVTPVCQKFDQCAVDWSLKTRVRFTSKTPFAFSSTLKVCFYFKLGKQIICYQTSVVDVRGGFRNNRFREVH